MLLEPADLGLASFGGIKECLALVVGPRSDTDARFEVLRKLLALERLLSSQEVRGDSSTRVH